MQTKDETFFKDTVRAWWRRFDPARRMPEKKGGDAPGYQGASLRGDLAELRRCGSSSEVIFCSGFHSLWATLRAEDRVQSGRDEQWLAIVAGVLAHVEDDIVQDEKNTSSYISFAQQMAAAPKGTDPVVSDLRFRKLLRATAPEDLFKQLSSTVRLMRRRANVADLAWNIRGLCSPWHEETRRDWALAYYEAAPNQPTKK